MSIPALREFINRHSASSAALAALGAVLDAKATGATLDPVLETCIRDLLAATGFGGDDVLADLNGAQVAPVLAEIRSMTAIEAKLLHTAKARSSTTMGWSYTDPEILQNVGETSAGFIQPLATNVVPNLDGLSDRLTKPGGAFLDVGTGVAGLAMAVARKWPELRVVGIDPWQPSLAIARENVAKAKLGDRVELREQRAEDLPDEDAFDLAWVPAIFMPEASVRPSCEKVLRSLRSGGWVLFNAIVAGGGDPQSAALWRLRMTMFGNSALPSATAETLLRDVGFTDVKTLPSPPGSFLCLVAGRRQQR